MRLLIVFVVAASCFAGGRYDRQRGDSLFAAVEYTCEAWTPCRVEVWTRHDLGYVADTVTALGPWHRSGTQWYLRSDDPSGETWSDRYPKIIE